LFLADVVLNVAAGGAGVFGSRLGIQRSGHERRVFQEVGGSVKTGL